MRFRSQILSYLLPLVLALFVISPSFINSAYFLLQLDGDIFMYSAQQWLRGERLYVDVADNKPPMVFIANAFGLLIGGGSPYGVACIIWASLAAFAVFFLRSTKHFGLLPSLIAISSLYYWLLRETFLNAVEVYALPCHMALFSILVKRQGNQYSLWTCTAAGIFSSTLFFFKPNLSSLGLVSLYVLTSTSPSPVLAIRRFLAYAAGAFALIGAVLLLIFATSSLGAMWNFAFRDAFIYTGSRSPVWKFIFIPFGVENLASSGLLALAIAAGLVVLWNTKFRLVFLEAPSFAAFVLVLELLAASISGRFYSHYLLLCFTPACFLLAYCLSQISFTPLTDYDSTRSLMFSLLCVLSLICILKSAHTYWKISKQSIPELHLATRIRNYLQPGDRVLIWSSFGFSPHFWVGGRPATRHFTSMATLQLDSLRDERVAELIGNVKTKRPRIIVDCVSSDIPPLFKITPSAVMDRDYVYRDIKSPIIGDETSIPQNYSLAELEGQMRCAIYLRKGEAARQRP
jgi:hypothetical protein